MSFTFTEDQKLLSESANRFVLDEYDFETRRKILNQDGGFDKGNWAKFAELGWLALPIAEEYGGLGGSTVDTAVLLEALGRGLVVEPYQSSIVLGAELLQITGKEEQKKQQLPSVAEAKTLLSFAHIEPTSRFNLSHIKTKASKEGDCYVVNGEKAIVHNAETADFFIVSARTEGDVNDHAGITLFVIPSNSEGIKLRSYPTIDGLRASELTLNAVKVDQKDILGSLHQAMPAIQQVVDRACVLLCAEAAGAMDTAVKLTGDYIKNREQFGQAIGSFQVLQHRAVEMLGAKDFSRALTYRAAGAIDQSNSSERARAVSAAKVEMGRSGKLIGQEGIQLHGGMGMTDDMPIGHFFKRLTMIDAIFGNVDFHRKRFAQTI